MKDILKTRVLELRQKGLSYRQIKKELNCTLSVISYHCRKNGLIKNPTEKPTEKEQKLFTDLYQEGKSLREISEITKWSRVTVGKYVKDRRVIYKKKTAAQAVIDSRRKKKQLLVEYKGGKCERCGYNKCIDALEFHHLDPLTKDFTISSSNLSLEKQKLEVDKCLLVCANCHREIHAGIA